MGDYGFGAGGDIGANEAVAGVGHGAMDFAEAKSVVTARKIN